MVQRHQDIRDAVAQLCGQYPGEYWREKDRNQEYPGEFVRALTEAGFLSDRMGQSALDLGLAPLIKVKLNAFDVVTRMTAVRLAQPKSRLIADANEAWDMDLLLEVAPALADLGVEMIEQPLPAGEDKALAGYESPVLLCADESCHILDDLKAMAGKYGMVNIKLDKTGGLTEALSLARAAEANGTKIMVGCMVATSLAMAPAMMLASFAEFVDLDGPLLLKDDREDGLIFESGYVHPPKSSLWGQDRSPELLSIIANASW